MARKTLIQLDVLGAVYGYTVDGTSVDVEDVDGKIQSFGPGGDVDALPFRSAPVTGGTSQDSSVRVTINNADALWAQRAVAPIQLATCRVFWWPEGELLRPEHELFRGAVRSPDWAIGDQLPGVTPGRFGPGVLSFGVVPATRSDDVAFPPFLVGDSGRFPSAPDEALTYAVPVVYGSPAGLPLVAVTSTAADPIRLAIASHRIKSTTVQLMRNGSNVGAPVAVSYAKDGLGGVYAYCEVARAVYVAGSDLYLGAVDGWAEGGALIDRLGDVMEHAYRTYAGASWYELDRPRVEAARPVLNRIAVAGFANERTDGTIMQFLKQRLGGQFPIAFSAAGGRFGWDATLFPRFGDDNFVVASIVFGQDAWERTGPTETSADDIITDIELSYGYDGFQAGAVRSIRFTPETSADAARAASRWGRSPILRMNAPDVADADSAYLLLSDLAVRRCRVRTRVEYAGLDEVFYSLPLASIVSVSDDELGWTDELCVLEAVEPRKDGLVDIVLVTVAGL